MAATNTAHSSIHPSVGDAAPDLNYRTRGGESRSLSAFWCDGPALVIWLRHLGCPFCAEALAQLHERESEFEKLHVRLACIVQGTASDAEERCGPHGMTAHCVPDPRRETYAQFGLDRTTWRALLFPDDDLARRRKSNRGAGFSINWKRSLKDTCDILLLPGAALVGRDGKILWLHRGANPGDLPSAEQLLDNVRRYV